MKKTLRIAFILLMLIFVTIQIYMLVSSRLNVRVIQICPTGAISMRGSKAVIDSHKCIGCQRCVLGIPAKIPPAAQRQDSEPTPKAELTVLKEEPMPAQETLNQKAVPSPVEVKNKQKPAPVPESKKTFSVNSDVCIGCQLCVSKCPTQAITMVNGKALIDGEKCINCGICKNGNEADYQGCPVNAISAP